MRLPGAPMMSKSIALCLVLITPAVVQANPPAKDFSTQVAQPADASCRRPTAADHKLADEWFALRRRIVKEYPDLIRRVESFPTDVRRQALQTPQELKAKLRAAEAGDIIPAPFLDSSFTEGSIGTLWGYSFRVIEQLGNSEARIGILSAPTDQELERGIRTNNNPVPEVEVFLRGFDLAAMKAGQRVKTRGCFIVRKPDATRAPGSPRVLVIEPYASTIAEMLFEKSVNLELWNAAHPETEAERDRKAAKIMVRMMRQRRANALKNPAILSNARNLIAAKLYDPAEKMLRQIVAEVPGSDAAERAQKQLDALPRH
jgi:hypothetical protein